MKIVCISDTHNYHPHLSLPEGDMLIHAGDFSMIGDLEEVSSVMNWLARLPYKHIIVVAGNHDLGFDRVPHLFQAQVPPNVTYLQDSGVEIEGLKIWGTPWQPHYPDWGFYASGDDIWEKFWKIPDDTNILISHTPMHNILDVSNWEYDVGWEPGTRVGCRHLRRRVDLLEDLKLHVCGHIHESYGREDRDGTIFLNASICDRNYDSDHLNPPIVIEL